MIVVVCSYRHITLSARKNGMDHLASSVRSRHAASVTALHISLVRILVTSKQNPNSDWLLQQEDLLIYGTEKSRGRT